MPAQRIERVAVTAIALLVFLLAYFATVEMSDSDAGLALVAAQGVLEYRTLSLDPFEEEPRFTYRLDGSDRRVERLPDGTFYYYSIGAALLPIPAVWLANRLGYDMLDLEAEYATQRLLSALGTATVFVLLWVLCRRRTSAPSAVAIATVFVLGSPLTSTLGTALWNSHYAVLAITGALICLSQPPGGGDRSSRRATVVAALLMMIAAVARPAAAILIAAWIPFLLDRFVRPRLAIPILLLVGGLVVWGVTSTRLDDLIPDYYALEKLVPETPPARGLYGTLLSPSRGLLVFCPFLVPVLAGVAWRFRSLVPDRLFGIVLLWIVLHTLAVSLREWWWGGHSYGPRLFTETLPGFALLAGLVWGRVGERREGRWRGLPISGSDRGLATAFVTLGLVAILVHSGQGLFNPSVRRWNESPNIDRNTELLFDWRYPQFLASQAALEARLVEHQRQSLLTYRPGETIGPDGEAAIFVGWHESEGELRWSRGTRSELLVRLDEVGPRRLYLLELEATALVEQTVSLSVNGVAVGRLRFRDGPPQRRVVAVPGGTLFAGQENRLELVVPRARRTEADSRILGLALHGLELDLLPSDFAGLSFDDDAFFTSGWSNAEAGWRWTDGPVATLAYPVAEVDAGETMRLEILAGTVGSQEAEVAVNEVDLGRLRLTDPAPAWRGLPLPPERLQPFALNEITLRLPDAVRVPGDARLLGLSVVSVRLVADQRDAVAPGRQEDLPASRSDGG